MDPRSRRRGVTRGNRRDGGHTHRTPQGAPGVRRGALPGQLHPQLVRCAPGSLPRPTRQEKAPPPPRSPSGLRSTASSRLPLFRAVRRDRAARSFGGAASFGAANAGHRSLQSQWSAGTRAPCAEPGAERPTPRRSLATRRPTARAGAPLWQSAPRTARSDFEGPRPPLAKRTAPAPWRPQPPHHAVRVGYRTGGSRRDAVVGRMGVGGTKGARRADWRRCAA